MFVIKKRTLCPPNSYFWEVTSRQRDKILRQVQSHLKFLKIWNCADSVVQASWSLSLSRNVTVGSLSFSVTGKYVKTKCRLFLRAFMEVHVQQQLKFFFPYNRTTEFTLSTVNYIKWVLASENNYGVYRTRDSIMKILTLLLQPGWTCAVAGQWFLH